MSTYNPELNTQLLNHLFDLAQNHCKSNPTYLTLRDYAKSLLGEVPRHNSWQMAEFSGHDNPYLYQNFLCRAAWDQESIRYDLVNEHKDFLSGKPYSLIVDETGFLKKGKHSCGVQRQYSGTAGKVENCQVAVFLACTSKSEHCLLDTRLYLPESWTDDIERCVKAGVPEWVTFQTKTEQAAEMIINALDQGMKPEWVPGDSVYGESSDLIVNLQHRQQPYVLGVTRKHYVFVDGEQKRVSNIIQSLLDNGQWQTLSSGTGTKGERLYQWLKVAIDDCGSEGWGHHLLLRKPLGSNKPDEVAVFRCYAPVEKSSLRMLVKASGKRWAIETCFEEAKGLLGMDEYEVRNWTPWYRHMTLVILAHTFLALTRAQEEKKILPWINSIDGTGNQNTAHKNPSLVNEKHTSTSNSGMVRISKAPPVNSYGVP